MSEQVAVSPLDFVDLVVWLNAWGRAQPDGLNIRRVRLLSRALGLSRVHLYNVLSSDRYLTPAATEALVQHMALNAKEAEHLAKLVELHHARGDGSTATRNEVWFTYADRHGLPREEMAAVLDQTNTSAATAAVLGVALAALGPEAPSPGVFAREARVVVSTEQVERAVADDAGGVRLAPGLIRLPDPALSVKAAEAWSGALGWVRESMMRTPDSRWRQHEWIWSADALAVAEIRRSWRRFEADFRRIAERHAHVQADHLMMVLAPMIPLTHAWRGPHKVWRSETEDRSLQDRRGTDTSASEMHDKPTQSTHPVVGHMSFGAVLSSWRVGRPPNLCSDGYLARRVGRKRSHVSDLSHGRVAFRQEHVASFVAALDLKEDPEAVAWLTGLARLSEPISPAERLSVLEVLGAMARARGMELPEIDWLLVTRWYVQATFALSFLPNFRPIPVWIVAALKGRISARAAREALNMLKRLGLLVQRPDGSWGPGRPSIEQDPGEAAPSFLVFQGELLRLLGADLDILSDEHDYVGCVAAMPEVAMPALKRSFNRHCVEVRAALDGADTRAAAGAPPDRVVLVTAHLLPVLDLPKRARLRS